MGDIDPTCPNLGQGYTGSKPKSPTPYFASDKVQYVWMSFKSWVIPVLGYFRHYENLGKLDPNTPNQGLGYTESNPKLATAHFLSNEALLMCKVHPNVKLYSFWIFGALVDLEEIGLRMGCDKQVNPNHGLP